MILARGPDFDSQIAPALLANFMLTLFMFGLVSRPGIVLLLFHTSIKVSRLF